MADKRVNTARWMEKQQRWQINVQRDGIRRSFTSSKPGRAGQREANAKADRWLDNGIMDDHISVETLWKQFLVSKKSDVGTGRYISIECFGRVWFLPKLGHMQVGRLTEVHLQSLLDDMAKKGLAHASIAMHRTTISSFIKFARRSKCTTLVLEDLHVSKKAQRGEKTILMPQELHTLFSVDTTLYARVRRPCWYIHAFRLAVLTGLRPGEVRGLKRSDRFGDTVNVQRSINELEEITPGKNENAKRSFVLTPLARAEWDAQVTMVKTAGISSEWMFPDESGKLTSYQRFKTRWEAYCKSNGIRSITLYELRHTFVSIVQNLPEGYLRALVGHSASMDTRGTYAHVMQDDAAKTAALVQDIFSDYIPKNNTG